MTLKVYQAFAFEMLYNRLQNETLPVRISYKLAKIYNAMIDETSKYHEQLAEALSKYADKNADGSVKLTEDGQNIKIKPGKENECAKALAEIQNNDMKFACDVRFILDDIEELIVTAQEMQALFPFIED